MSSDSEFTSSEEEFVNPNPVITKSGRVTQPRVQKPTKMSSVQFSAEQFQTLMGTLNQNPV